MLRRLLLATVSALALSPGPAAAMPVTFAAAAAWYASLTVLGQALVQIGISVALTAAAALLTPRPSVPALKRELQVPSSRPPYRYVYGRTRMTGSPAPWRVRGRYLWGCLILNSRPSAGGTVRVWIDKRPCTITGDPYDFAGPGAEIDVTGVPWRGPKPRFWIGRGDQTSPPAAILSAASTFFDPADGWRGLTVAWVELYAGPDKGRQRRWPRVPPEIEFEMDWSRVWDPADPAQEPDDPTSWTWSANQALCLLDALRTNPVRPYPLALLHMPSFEAGALVAAQIVPTLANPAGEPRYETHGFVVWSGAELTDQVRPLAEAGAGEMVRIGGRLGYRAGAWTAAVVAVTDLVESGGIDFRAVASAREVPNAIRASYISLGRGGEEAELPIRQVPGAGAPLGAEGVREVKLPFVTSPTQAQRVAKIEAFRAGRQKRLSCVLFPEALPAAAGSVVQVALGEGFTAVNGLWEVVSADPGVWLLEAEGGAEGELALRIPVSLREIDAEVYAWDPATDEQATDDTVSPPAPGDVEAPGTLTLTTGESAAVAGLPYIRVTFEPVDEADHYEWQIGPTGEINAETGIADPETLNASGDIEILYGPVEPGTEYTVRVRTIAVRGATADESNWTTGAITALAPNVDLDPPVSVTATGGPGEIEVEILLPNSADLTGVEVLAGDTSDVGAAASLGFVWSAPNATVIVSETGLGSAQTRFYWARSVAIFSAFSAFTGPSSATTDP